MENLNSNGTGRPPHAATADHLLAGHVPRRYWPRLVGPAVIAIVSVAGLSGAGLSGEVPGEERGLATESSRAGQRADETVREDRVTLHSGQVLVGSVEERRVGPQNIAELVVRQADGSTLILQREMFREWQPENPAMPEYRQRAAAAGSDVIEQWALAEWCEANKLKPQAESHARRVLELDDQHEKARRLVGHIRIRDQWVDVEQVKVRLGYVKVGRTWQLPEVAELAGLLKSQQDKERSWKKDLSSWFRTAFSNRGRSGEAMAKIEAVEDPSAVPVLAEMMEGRLTVPERAKVVEVLAGIKTLAASQSLLDFYLRDVDDPESRELAIRELSKRDAHRPILARRLVDQLNPDLLGDRSKLTNPSIPVQNTQRLTRVATALRWLDVRIGIEPLIVAMRLGYTIKIRVQDGASSGPNGVQGAGGQREIKRT